LALFAVASLAFQPFTEPYAREVVQRKYWTTARFTRTNVELSLMWAVVLAATAASLAAAGVVQTSLRTTVFGGVRPNALHLLGAGDLTLAQYRVFAFVAARAERSSPVARGLALAKPTVTAAVDGLVERKLLTREAVEGDRRSLRLAVTLAGEAAMRDVERLMG